MTIKFLKSSEKYGKDKIYKRWLESDGKIIECHITLIRKIGLYEQDIMRYDYDLEGSHFHLKALEVPHLSLEEAQTIVKNFDTFSKELTIRILREIKK